MEETGATHWYFTHPPNTSTFQKETQQAPGKARSAQVRRIQSAQQEEAVLQQYVTKNIRHPHF